MGYRFYIFDDHSSFVYPWMDETAKKVSKIIMNETIYQILVWIVPVLFVIIGWFLIRILGQIEGTLKRMDRSVNDLRITVEGVLIKHDGLEERVDKSEIRIERLEEKRFS